MNLIYYHISVYQLLDKCLFISDVAVVHNAEAGCKDDLMAANKACFDSYNTYLANLGQSGADSSQIMVKLCTYEINLHLSYRLIE
jgi:hypothetical protein